MIERQTIDGRQAFVAYVKGDFEPCDAADATLIKVIFDDGGMLFLTPQDEAKKYSPDQPRDDHGRFGEGSGLPQAKLVSRTLRPMVESGYKLKVESKRDDVHVVRPIPPIPEGIKEYGSGRRGGYYDPSLSSIVTEDPGTEYARDRVVPNDGLSQDVPATREAGVIFRGMSAGEYAAFQKTGEIRSAGNYNLEGQDNLTYWSNDPEQAQHYASSFAPAEYKATFERPAYVVAAKHPGAENTRHVPGTGEDEVGVAVPIKASDVTAVYRGRVFDYTPGSYDLRHDDVAGTLTEGSSTGPSSSLVWDKVSVAKLVSADLVKTLWDVPMSKGDVSNEARDEHGRWTADKEQEGHNTFSWRERRGGPGRGVFKTQEEATTFIKDMFSGMPGQWAVDAEQQSDGAIRFTAITTEGVSRDMTRTIKREPDGSITVEHNTFFVSESGQAKGIAKQILAQSMAAYQKLGVSRIELDANMKVGGYAWAKFGFLPYEGSLTNMKHHVSADQNKSADAKMEVSILRHPKDMWALADSPIGKEALLGTSWGGVLRLDDKEAMARFNSYVHSAAKAQSSVSAGPVLFEWQKDKPKPDGWIDGMTLFMDDFVAKRDVSDEERDEQGKWTSGGSGYTRNADKHWVHPEHGKMSAKDQAMDALRVPPAWTDVRLNPNPDGELQVVGKDAKDRPQYLYSAAHSEAAAAEKFARMKEFVGVRPTIQAGALKTMQDTSLSQSERDSGAVLYMIDQTGFRIGSTAETGGAKQAYGASTLTAGHVKINGDKLSFSFSGKHGVQISKTITNPALAKYIGDRKQEVGRGRLFATSGGKVNALLDSVAGTDGFSVKDYRTFHGTVIALKEVASMRVPKNATAYKKARFAVGDKVSKFLGNTRAVALSSYIDPAVFGPWKKAA